VIHPWWGSDGRGRKVFEGREVREEGRKEEEEKGEKKKTPKDQGLLVRACLSVLMEKRPGLF
jgi:hypothetical protein